MKKKRYQIIQEDLLNLINTGILKPGEKLPTEAELMAKYDVSRITIGKALFELKENGIIYSNTKNGTFVGDKKTDYKENLLIPFVGTLKNEKFIDSDILSGIQSVAIRNNCIVPFYNTNNLPDQEREILKKILLMGVSAVLLLPCSGFSNIDLISKLIINKIPLIFIDRRPQGLKQCLVTTDNYNAMKQLIQHLVKNKYRKIATTIIGVKSQPEIERFNGFINGLIENGIEPNPDYFLGDINIYNKYYDKSSTQRLAFMKLYMNNVIDKYLSLKEKPEVICCTNDNDAAYLISGFEQRFGKIPNNLIITGFDNLNFPLLAHSPTVEQDFFTIGKTAMEAMLQLLNGISLVDSIQIEAKCIFKDETI